MLKISILALASALSLAGCDRGGLTDPDDLNPGQFEGEITGRANSFLDGEALSGSTVSGFHDVIVLTDYSEDIEVILYHETDEFFEGRHSIGDAVAGNQPIVAYVHLLRTGEWFDSLTGVIDLYDVYDGGITGIASFRAESEEVLGEIVDVEVSFVTDWAGRIDFNLSPSFSAGAKAPAGAR